MFLADEKEVSMNRILSVAVIVSLFVLCLFIPELFGYLAFVALICSMIATGYSLAVKKKPEVYIDLFI